jgi:para-nitrobenzyl esterase
MMNLFKSLKLKAFIVATLCSCVTILGACGKTNAVKSEQSAPQLIAGGETLTGIQLENGVNAFLGIPFAAAPVGELRWSPAQPHPARNGIQDATQYGPACPQSQGNPEWYRMVVEGFGGNPSVVPDLENISEDCLYLNVWTPRKTTSDLPIMIWMHGGSNVNGWAYEPNYVGDQLAAKGAVVITVHYRLGSLGFLPLPFGDHPDRGGNYGLSDLIIATEWAKDNAAHFGGDPDNITVFGESSGAGNIFALMKSPKTGGLFQRVIIESGALGPADSLPKDQVLARSAQMFDILGIRSVDQARALPWQELVDLHKMTDVSHYHGPVVDDFYVRSGDTLNADIDVLAGSNLNEMLMYLDGDNPALVADNLVPFPASLHPAITQGLDATDLSVLEKADRLSTAAEFHCPARFIADGASGGGNAAYLYRFTRKRHGADQYGAYHGAEIPYIFNKHDNWLPTDEADTALTQVIMQYWINFAKTGDPNGESLPPWPRHEPGENKLQNLGDDVSFIADFAAPLCDALEDK